MIAGAVESHVCSLHPDADHFSEERMSIRRFYLGFAVLGLAIPNSAFWSWLLTHGLDPQRFCKTSSATVSVLSWIGRSLISAGAQRICLDRGKRLGLRHRWLPIAATCLVGVSLGLPLFLYQQQVHLERVAA
jgi:hypothetical protein